MEDEQTAKSDDWDDEGLPHDNGIECDHLEATVDILAKRIIVLKRASLHGMTSGLSCGEFV